MKSVEKIRCNNVDKRLMGDTSVVCELCAFKFFVINLVTVELINFLNVNEYHKLTNMMGYIVLMGTTRYFIIGWFDFCMVRN